MVHAFLRHLANTQRTLARWMSAYRTARQPPPDNLQRELEDLNHRIAKSEHIVSGWHDFIERYPDEHDTTEARSLLACFERDLVSDRVTLDLIHKMIAERQTTGNG